MPGGDVVDVAGDAHLRGEQGRGEQALHVGFDGGVRVGDGGGLQCCLGQAGRLGRLLPEGGIGQKSGAALGVLDDRDFEEPVSLDLAAEQLLGEEGEVGDVVDDGLGDAPPALRMTGASASWSPRTIAGSTRWSRQVRMSTGWAGTPSGAGV